MESPLITPAYFTGNTASTNFPTVNAVQPAFGDGGGVAFVTKLGPPGDRRALAR
jgi:hypothetical protein